MKILGKRIFVSLKKEENNDTKLKKPGITKVSKVEKTIEKEKFPNIGKVIALGTGVMTTNGKVLQCECKINDEVIFTPFAGTPIVKNGEKIIALNELDVLAIIRDDKILTLGDNIIIEQIKEENIVNGIKISLEKDNNTYTGKVVIAGKGRLLNTGIRDLMEVSKGDIIAYNYLKGTKIKIEDKEYLVLKKQDVLFVLDE